MAMIVISYDGRAVRIMEAKAAKLASPSFRRYAGNALGRAGDKTRTQVRRAIYRQAGYKKMSTVISRTRSFMPEPLTYVIEAKGKPAVPIEDVKGTRVIGKGVRSAPWNVGRLFQRSFSNKGLWARLPGAKRYPRRRLYGPSVAKEAIEGNAAETFFKTSEKEMSEALGKLLARYA
jgi:hypothetical protein